MKVTLGVVLIGLTIAGCEEGAAVTGIVKNIDTQAVVVGADVGFAQLQAGNFTVREDFTSVTDDEGQYEMSTDIGPFPEGFILFSHDDYLPDTVDFYGAESGKTEQVNVFLVFSGPTDTSSASAAPQ